MNDNDTSCQVGCGAAMLAASLLFAGWCAFAPEDQPPVERDYTNSNGMTCRMSGDVPSAMLEELAQVAVRVERTDFSLYISLREPYARIVASESFDARNFLISLSRKFKASSDSDLAKIHAYYNGTEIGWARYSLSGFKASF